MPITSASCMVETTVILLTCSGVGPLNHINGQEKGWWAIHHVLVQRLLVSTYICLLFPRNVMTHRILECFKFSFSYYADTFMYGGVLLLGQSPSPIIFPNMVPGTYERIWRPIASHHRSSIWYDVFFLGGWRGAGGFINNDFVPSRKTAIPCTFGDL